MVGRFRIRSWQTPILIGDFIVNRGDLILVDIEAPSPCRVLSLPLVLIRAEEISKRGSYF